MNRITQTHVLRGAVTPGIEPYHSDFYTRRVTESGILYTKRALRSIKIRNIIDKIYLVE